MQHTSTMGSKKVSKALPPNSIMLHIGAHKTGTTSLQSALFAARQELMEQGVINVVSEGDETANLAARAVQRLPASGSAGAPVPYYVWTKLVAQAKAHPTNIVSISAEAFAVSESQVIRTIVNDLGQDRLHVVITLRPISKILPSQWQQDLHGSWVSLEFEDWLKRTLKDASPVQKFGPIQVPHQFWFRHRHDALLQRWLEVVGHDRITLVVVDDTDKDSLLNHFEQLLALKAGTLSTKAVTRNQSMTLPEMQIMQRYSELLESTELGQKIVTQSRYHKALRILRKLRPDNANDARLVIPAWSFGQVSQIQLEMIERMESSGVGVIGLLSQLNWLPERSEVSERAVGHVGESELQSLSAKMLKSAARRLGVAETGSHTAPYLKRLQSSRRYLGVWAGLGRLVRLGVRFIRIRT